jgi:hypothetical protein
MVLSLNSYRWMRHQQKVPRQGTDRSWMPDIVNRVARAHAAGITASRHRSLMLTGFSEFLLAVMVRLA